jgi:hypothetical protein
MAQLKSDCAQFNRDTAVQVRHDDIGTAAGSTPKVADTLKYMRVSSWFTRDRLVCRSTHSPSKYSSSAALIA